MKWLDKFKESVTEAETSETDKIAMPVEITPTPQEQEDDKIDEMIQGFTKEITVPIEEPITQTIIQDGVEIFGDIVSNDNMTIYGNIKGDVLCEGTLRVHGWIQGTVTCADGDFDQAIILGNVHCSDLLKVSNTSSINGNVETLNLLSGGKIKGDTLVYESAKFNNTAAVVGNVQSRDIEIERGAIVQGNIRMLQDIEIEK